MARNNIDIEEIRQALSSLSGIPSNDVDGFLEAFFLVGKAKGLLATLKEQHQKLSWETNSRCVGTIRKISRPLKDGSFTEDMRIYHPAGKSCPRCGEYKASQKMSRLEKTVARNDWDSAIEAIENHKRLCEIDELIRQTINVIGSIESSIPTDKSSTLRRLLKHGRELATPQTPEVRNFIEINKHSENGAEGVDDEEVRNFMQINIHNGNGAGGNKNGAAVENLDEGTIPTTNVLSVVDRKEVEDNKLENIKVETV